jgi:hypothetical protein
MIRLSSHGVDATRIILTSCHSSEVITIADPWQNGRELGYLTGVKSTRSIQLVMWIPV